MKTVAGRNVDLRFIIFDQSQIISLPDGVEVYDNSHASRPDLCESGVFLDFLLPNGIPRWPASADYVGLLSWKFFLKTGLTAETLERKLDKCLTKGKPDLILFNPFPYREHCFFNIWDHGEYWHPGIKDLVRYSGLNRGVLNHYHGIKYTTFCNYVIASQNFWESYLTWLSPVAEVLFEGTRSGDIVHRHFHKEKPLTYVPYFLERCLSTYLALENNWDFVKFNISPDRDGYSFGCRALDRMKKLRRGAIERFA